MGPETTLSHSHHPDTDAAGAVPYLRSSVAQSTLFSPEFDLVIHSIGCITVVDLASLNQRLSFCEMVGEDREE